MDNVKNTPPPVEKSLDSLLAVIPPAVKINIKDLLDKKPQIADGSGLHFIPAPWAKYRENDGYLQTSGMTQKNRYPKIYASAASLKPKAKRVLSFGCSTGEEVFALAELFPKAERIVGVDIDHNRIMTGRAANKQDNIYFYDTIAGIGQFDVITALNVFFRLEKPLEKDKWTKTLEDLAKHVAPGGVLLIFKSDYNPMDVLSKEFKAENEFVHLHNRNSVNYCCGYYRKKKANLFW